MQETDQTVASFQIGKQLSLKQGMAYALPTIAVSFLMSPIAIIQGIYAKYFGLTLTTIAAVMLIARLFDAFIDPVIGYWSDRYYAHTGNRKPFVFSGGLLVVVSSYFLYVPVGSGDQSALVHVSANYFMLCFMAFFAAWTLFEIPHLAWGGELAANSDGKNKIYTLRAIGTYLGSLIFYIVPLLPFFETAQFTPQTLKWSVILAGLLMIPMLYNCIRIVPGNLCNLTRTNKNRQTTRGVKHSKVVFLSFIWKNQPFLLFIAALAFSGIGIGMWFGVMFIFIDSYLGLGNRFALVYLLSMIMASLSLMGWHQLANRMGKKYAWSLSQILMFSGVLGACFVSPGESNCIQLLLIMMMINSGYAAMAILAPSLLADISDYGTWKFKIDYSATYFSIYTLAIKTSAAVGGAFSLTIAGWYGFDATAIHHSEDSVIGLILAGTWLPPLLALLALMFIFYSPITTHRHAIIRRRLYIRENR